MFKTDLKGKVALITGAAQGLGAYFAELLAKNNAQVFVAGRESALERLSKVTQKITGQGGKATPLILDLTQLDSFEKQIAEIVKVTGSLDILVNNAAVSADKPIFEVSEADWDFHMDTNLKGLFFLSQAAAKQMKQQAQGVLHY